MNPKEVEAAIQEERRVRQAWLAANQSPDHAFRMQPLDYVREDQKEDMGLAGMAVWVVPAFLMGLALGYAWGSL